MKFIYLNFYKALRAAYFFKIMMNIEKYGKNQWIQI